MARLNTDLIRPAWTIAKTLDWRSLAFAKQHRKSSTCASNSRLQYESLETRQVLAAPVATNDVLLTSQNDAIQVSYLLANDYDADDHSLSIASFSQGTSGSVVADGNGGLVYTPMSGYVGSDSFTYTVTDNVDGSDTATVSVSVNADINIETARDQILSGVSLLANPGGPGTMLAYGPTAFSVSNYSGSNIGDPMIGAATLEQGRVVLMPDHQWLRMDQYGATSDTGTLYTNAIAWLANSSAKNIKIVTWYNGNKSWLESQGFSNVMQTNTTNIASDLQNADVFVAGWLGNNVSQSAIDAVSEYTRGGGGLLIADYGVGYDYWWNQDTADIPSNRLLADAGLGVSKVGTRSVYSIDRGVGQMNYNDVLDVLRNPAIATASEKATASAYMTALSDMLPENDSRRAELLAETLAAAQNINATPSTPVTDSFEQALLTIEMRHLAILPADQVTAHRTAEAVYGAIPSGAARLSNQNVSIDTSITGRIATGFYAAPGELVTVTVPNELVDQGFSIRINNHVDNISGRSSWLRSPLGISREFAIESNTVEVANAFGGQIFIDLGGQAAGIAANLGPQTITIDNAIQAPHFVLGETTNSDWVNTIRNHPAPLAEFTSQRLAFSVPSEWIRDLDDPIALMQFWDEIVARQDWVGGFDGTRSGPDRINYDVQISVGLLHAGYPMQGPVSYGSDIVDLKTLRIEGDWGWFHELGHEMQRQPSLGWGWNNFWTFPGDTEVTVNIFANAAMELAAPNASLSTGWAWSVFPAEVMSRAKTTVDDQSVPNFDQKNPYPFYFQLADGPWGWQGYRDVLSTYVSDAQNAPGNLPNGGQEEKDQWYIRWSQQTGFDMTQYMVDEWGLEVSQAALDQVAGLNLPSWMPLATSLANPIEVRHEKSQTIDLAAAGLSLNDEATLISVGSASNGTLVDSGNGIYTYTPNDCFVGSDSFTVTYQSEAGNQQTFTHSIVVQAPSPTPDQDQWTLVSVDSEETNNENGAAVNAFDGDSSTIWHTRWSSNQTSHPHEIVIDLGATYDLNSLSYLPRQVGTNGRIANYEFYVSDDVADWGQPVVTGQFPNTTAEQIVNFTSKAGKFVRLVALSEVNGNAWTSVAELNLTGDLVVEPATILAQRVSYGGATADYGEDTLANDKTALLPGQTATFANYTSYVRGINRVAIDVSNSCHIDQVSIDDFVIETGNGSSHSDFSTYQGSFSVAVEENAGSDNSDRVILTFPDGDIINTWLKVTVQANDDTNLADDFVFYFGNAIGETGGSDASVTSEDVLATRANRTSPFNPADESNRYDFDRSGSVDSTDVLIARRNRTNPFNVLNLITAPTGSGSNDSGSGFSAGPGLTLLSGHGNAGDSSANLASGNEPANRRTIQPGIVVSWWPEQSNRASVSPIDDFIAKGRFQHAGPNLKVDDRIVVPPFETKNEISDSQSRDNDNRDLGFATIDLPNAPAKLSFADVRTSNFLTPFATDVVMEDFFIGWESSENQNEAEPGLADLE